MLCFQTLGAATVRTRLVANELRIVSIACRIPAALCSNFDGDATENALPGGAKLYALWRVEYLL